MSTAPETSATTPINPVAKPVPPQPSAAPKITRQALINRIRSLGPWHMGIQLTEQLNTGQVFSDEGTITNRPSNGGVSLLQLREYFVNRLKQIYPDGIEDKRFLDCACNAGGYCFWARELGVKHAFGFDVRDHWINQARFVKNRRTVAPTNRIQFAVSDLYDLPKRNLAPFQFTNFKGIFYHLPDPVTGLKVAADLTEEVMFFNTSTTWGEKDGYMKSGWESKEAVMSGVHGLKWYPTGPKVCADMLRWLGFTDIKLIFNKQQYDQPQLGRIELIASKKPGLLERVPGESL